MNQEKSTIDKIRDIILGEEIERWNSIIDQFKKDYENLHNKLIDLEARLRNDISKNSEEFISYQRKNNEAIKELREEFEQKIKQLAENKVDRSQIGQAFIEWGLKVKQETGQ